MQHYFQNLEGWFDFPYIYQSAVAMNNNATFVEVGSWQGKAASFMAVEIINSNKNIKLCCVDTWEGSIEHKEENIIVNKELYNTFLKNIEPVKHVITPIKMASVDAARTFEDNSLDFVFIDAAHDYENVRADLTAWYPKVKPGGMLAGHDHTWPGVVKAVNEFVTNSCLTLHIIGVQDCWGFIKRGRLLRVPTPEEAAPAIKALGKL
jgi:predicted O-methyltransferase YrrM